jgi:hypothetical protein
MPPFRKENETTKKRIHPERFFHLRCDALPHHLILCTQQNVSQSIHPCAKNRNATLPRKGYLSAAGSHPHLIVHAKTHCQYQIAIPDRHPMTPEKVARKGVNALFKNKAEIIPGYTNKLFFTLSQWAPHSVISMINRRRIKGKI